jgi:hypothetical protein
VCERERERVADSKVDPRKCFRRSPESLFPIEGLANSRTFTILENTNISIVRIQLG